MHKGLINKYEVFFRNTIKEFGGGAEEKLKYVPRRNTEDKNRAAYFGCVNLGENSSGLYFDLSIVIFPGNEEGSTTKDPNEQPEEKWIIALAVGTQGYKNDGDLAAMPGIQRLFKKYLPENNAFIKYNFLDITSRDGFLTFVNENELPGSLDKAIGEYANLVLVASTFTPSKDNDDDIAKDIIRRYLAVYSKFLRRWPSNNDTRNAVDAALKLDSSQTTSKSMDEEDERNVKALLEQRKYVVLQGAPGTGKTRLAKKIADEDKGSQVFFTQFHAETTYSDFIYGILPNTESNTLSYRPHYGVFINAIEAAEKEMEQENPKSVYLIIDEINRANLSNVLGSAFYLFEPTMSESNVEVEVCPGLKISKLPDNLYVIATMNTADRSLAVVDFALRRRFAWYTLYPHVIDMSENEKYAFCDDVYNKIADIFEKYATDEELSLQPGHAYFIVNKDSYNAISDTISDTKKKEAANNNKQLSKKENKEIKEKTEVKVMENRIRYEIMPLIKEYLNDGMIYRSRDEFVNLFRTWGEDMYR